MLQENIETIKNLKDELTIEQLQLIQSICKGKLEQIQGPKTERPKMNEQVESAQESSEKPQVGKFEEFEGQEEELE